MAKRKEEKLQISAVIETKFVRELDAIAEADQRTRADLIRFAVIEYVEKHRIKERPAASQ